MTRTGAENVIIYYSNIPEMLKYEHQEVDQIEATYYSGLKAVSADGMPHGSSVGRPTERDGLKAAENDAHARLEKAKIRIKTLEGDREIIDRAINSMNDRYKTILVGKYLRGYSYVKISTDLNAGESTIRWWLKKALERFGEILENDVVMIEEMEERASRAR